MEKRHFYQCISVCSMTLQEMSIEKWGLYCNADFQITPFTPLHEVFVPNHLITTYKTP